MPNPQQKTKDPRQQQLRQHKKQWSLDTSALIAKIIAFKRALNGRGDAKNNLPPSNIKDPLPKEVGAYLTQLANEFQQMASDAGTIIQEQETYSHTRRKRRPKTPPGQAPSPEAQAPATPMSEAPKPEGNPLANLATQNIPLEKTASSRLSRFWQYISSTFSSKQYNKQRLGLLSLAADLFYNLLDFENDILNLKITSIPKAISRYQISRYNLDALNRSYEQIVVHISEQKGVNGKKVIEQTKQEQANPQQQKEPETTPQDEPATQEERSQQIQLAPSAPQTDSFPLKEDLQEIINDTHTLARSRYGYNHAIQEVSAKAIEAGLAEDPEEKLQIANEARKMYVALLQKIRSDMGKKYQRTNFSSVEDLAAFMLERAREEQTKKKSSQTEDYFIKEAHSKITRFLKKQLVKALPFNKTAPHRLEIVEILNDTKKRAQELMNMLEQGFNLEEVQKKITELSNDFKRVKRPLATLNVMHKSDYFSSKEKEQIDKYKGKAPHEDQFLDWITKRRVRRDLSEDLF